MTYDAHGAESVEDQSDAFGDLDQSIRRNLRCEKDDGAGVLDRRARQTRQGVALKAGALLVREWKGRLKRVMILEEGFAWNGQTFSVVQSAGVLRMRIMRMGLSSSH